MRITHGAARETERLVAATANPDRAAHCDPFRHLQMLGRGSARRGLPANMLKLGSTGYSVAQNSGSGVRPRCDQKLRCYDERRAPPGPARRDGGRPGGCRERPGLGGAVRRCCGTTAESARASFTALAERPGWRSCARRRGSRTPGRTACRCSAVARAAAA